MKKWILGIGLILMAVVLAAACSNNDEDEGIVGTWRTEYVSTDGYNMSIVYFFGANGEYNSSTSYRGVGLPTMQLNTRGEYTFSGTSLSIIEKAYDFYDEEAGGSSGKYNNMDNTMSFPAKITGKTLKLSNYKHSALTIGDISFKKD